MQGMGTACNGKCKKNARKMTENARNGNAVNFICIISGIGICKEWKNERKEKTGKCKEWKMQETKNTTTP